jgi:hypothetical protein
LVSPWKSWQQKPGGLFAKSVNHDMSHWKRKKKLEMHVVEGRGEENDGAGMKKRMEEKHKREGNEKGAIAR